MPPRSDERVFTDQIGCGADLFSPTVDLPLPLAVRNPSSVVGLHAVFDTTDGFPTTLLGTVNALAPTA